jgi:hypothetical protein
MKIENYKSIDRGMLVASFDLTIEEWGVTFRKITLFAKSDKRWISFPSLKFDGSDGKPAYYAYVVMEKEKKERMEKAIMVLLDAKNYTVGKETPAATAQDEECPF